MKVNSIQKLIEESLSDIHNNQIKFEVGTVKKQIADSIKSITGLDVSGYKCIVDNFAIKHTIFQHGNSDKESKRGQIAVTIDLFEKIPSILNNPDRIIDGGKSKIGRRIIIYEKRFNGYLIYIEEIRTKRKELAMLTMYIKKAR
jgi:hypothetical protein